VSEYVGFKVLGDLPRERFGQGLRDHLEPIVYRCTHLGLAASIAVDLAKHLGIVSAQVDGEDSVGRQKLRLLEPDEVADRACAIAQALVHGFNQREWLLHVPDPVPRKKDEKEKELED